MNLDMLNEQQRGPVLTTDGPLLILGGRQWQDQGSYIQDCLPDR